MARNKYDVDELLDTPFNIKQFRRVLGYSVKYKKQLIGALTVMLVGSALNLLSPIIIMQVMNVSIPEKNIAQLWMYAGAYTGIIIIASLFTSYRMKTTNTVGQMIIHDIRLDMYKHLHELPFTYFDSRPHGKILVRLVNYVNTISDLLSTGLINSVVDMVSIVVILVYMLLVDPFLTLFALAGVPLIVLYLSLIRRAQRRGMQRLSMKSSNLNAYTQESLLGMRTTQSFTREETNRGIYHKLSTDYRKAWMVPIMINIAAIPVVDTITNATVALLYTAGALWLRDAVTGAPIQAGTIVAFVGYVWRFWQPINNLANFYNQLQSGAAYIERICEFLNEPRVIEDRPGAKPLGEIEGRVEFQDVTFAYEEGRNILENFSFTARPGMAVALVGPTGAGKTTVVNLLARFYDIQGGRILIDGKDIALVTQDSLRVQMGMMLQEPFLFPETVMENIRYGRLDATDEECIAAAKAVCAHEFIMKLPQGYATEIKQNGGGVSAGERQLISFARVMLSDPRLLILDEATASIDTRTERALQQGLNEMLKGRTSFIIAHRLSTIKSADTIIYISNKGIAEQGNHEELLQNGTYYKELYMNQLAGLL